MGFVAQFKTITPDRYLQFGDAVLDFLPLVAQVQGLHPALDVGHVQGVRLVQHDAGDVAHVPGLLADAVKAQLVENQVLGRVDVDRAQRRPQVYQPAALQAGLAQRVARLDSASNTSRTKALNERAGSDDDITAPDDAQRFNLTQFWLALA